MIRVTVDINHDPGSAAVSAAVPVIAATMIGCAAEGLDAVLQALGVSGVTIEVDVNEVDPPWHE